MKIISSRFVWLCNIALLLNACSVGNVLDNLPSRAPDYRQSTVGRKIEIPPDLTQNSYGTSLSVSDFNPPAVTSYSDYAQDKVKRDRRGYIEVLPNLDYVKVVEEPNALPYIKVDADIDTTWRIVKQYWANNGIRLSKDDPGIGIMETDWLENKSDLPASGVNTLLGGMLSLLQDSDQRDRYRLRFSRLPSGQTEIVLIYSKSEQVAQYDIQTGKDPAGFKWRLSDNKNPELQLEMTRRIALYIDAMLKNKHKTEVGNNSSYARTAQITQLPDGQNALIFKGPYAQVWRILGIAIDRAGFTILSNQYATGSYQIRYIPQSDNNPALLAQLREKQGTSNQQLQYLVRIADKGKESVVVIQTLDGHPANSSEARILLETIQSAL